MLSFSLSEWVVQSNANHPEREAFIHSEDRVDILLEWFCSFARSIQGRPCIDENDQELWLDVGRVLRNFSTNNEFMCDAFLARQEVQNCVGLFLESCLTCKIGLLGRVALSFLANLSRKNLLVQEILWGKYLNDELLCWRNIPMLDLQVWDPLLCLVYDSFLTGTDLERYFRKMSKLIFDFCTTFDIQDISDGTRHWIDLSFEQLSQHEFWSTWCDFLHLETDSVRRKRLILNTLLLSSAVFEHTRKFAEDHSTESHVEIDENECVDSFFQPAEAHLQTLRRETCSRVIERWNRLSCIIQDVLFHECTLLCEAAGQSVSHSNTLAYDSSRDTISILSSLSSSVDPVLLSEAAEAFAEATLGPSIVIATFVGNIDFLSSVVVALNAIALFPDDCKPFLLSGTKTSLLRSVANLSYNSGKLQEILTDMNALPILLNHTRVDDDHPLCREWALFGIRNLSIDNPRNQEFIESLRAQHISNPDELERLGFRAELDEESGNVLFRSTRKRDDNTTNESSSSTLAACPTDGN